MGTYNQDLDPVLDRDGNVVPYGYDAGIDGMRVAVASQTLTLLDDASATGSWIVWPGGRGAFAAWGAFGGAAVKLQWSPDGGTTVIDADQGGDTYCTLTAAGSGLAELPSCVVRAHVSGGSGVSVTAILGRTG